MTSPVVEIGRLAHRWRGASGPTLRGVSLSIAQGERVGLIGPNGAGKSTLVAHLNGTLLASPPIHVCGLPVDRAHLDRARQHVGVVQQETDDQLFMPTVREDVAFGPLNRGLDAAAVDERVSRALAQVDASALADRSSTTLSGGERRRVAIASVLSMDVDLLVLDEPTSNLDARGRRAIVAVLRGLPQTLLIATHDLDLVAAVCERVILLDDGQIVADGATATILADHHLLEQHGVR